MIRSLILTILGTAALIAALFLAFASGMVAGRAREMQNRPSNSEKIAKQNAVIALLFAVLAWLLLLA